MRKQLTFVALAATLVGLGASIASAIDDLGPQITFCAESGCRTVHQSAWAKPLGIPMSLLGVAYFAAMLGLTFVERRRLRIAAAIAGGAWAVWLIVLQGFVIEAWCKLCMVADPASIVLTICVLAGAETLRPKKQALLLAPLLAGIVALLALWTRAANVPDAPVAGTPEAETPAFVVNAQTDNAVTIVELVDFECPFCREMQKRIDEARTRTQVPVRLVRKMVPLGIHRGAAPAAIAYCCADAQGKGEEMAKLLFAADPSELTPYGCQQMAEKVGCDLDRYHNDVQAAIQRVQSDLKDAKDAGVRGLPTFFIGHDRHQGATMSVDDLVAAIEAHAP